MVEPTIKIRAPRARAGGVRTLAPMICSHVPRIMKPLRGRAFWQLMGAPLYPGSTRVAPKGRIRAVFGPASGRNRRVKGPENVTMESAAKASKAVPAKNGGRRSAYDHKMHARSAVSNGNELLPDLSDGRSVWVRRVRDIVAELVSDFPEPSAAERMLFRRIATLVTIIEQHEAKFANAGEASGNQLDDYQRAAGNLRRLLESLGHLKGRRAKDVTQSWDDIAAEVRAADGKDDAS
jgi:hypothetical protein